MEMDDETDTETAWESIGNLAAARLTQPPSLSRTSQAEGRSRAFAACLTPCLSLASGVGMSAQDQRVWMNAAYRALAEYPMDLIESGAREAMKVADHPSKIVPAIIREISEEWGFRQRTAHLPPAPTRASGDMVLLEDTPHAVYDHDKLVSLATTSWGRPLVSMLLKVGNITQDQFDRAMVAASAE